MDFAKWLFFELLGDGFTVLTFTVVGALFILITRDMLYLRKLEREERK
jgi:hypothetical protein